MNWPPLSEAPSGEWTGTAKSMAKGPMGRFRRAPIPTSLARLFAELPYADSHLGFDRAEGGFRSSFFALLAMADFPVERFNGVLASPTKGVADFIDHGTLAGSIPARVARPTIF